MVISKKLKKIYSFFLILSIIVITNISPVTAHTLDSLTYLDPDKNNGVYLVENLVIEGNNYKFTHSIKDGNNVIDISGAENHTIVANANLNKLYIDNEEIAPINIVESSDGWTYFSDKITVTWKAGASAAVISAIIASAVGGPVGMFFGAGSALAGSSIGCDIYHSGRYKIDGNHVQGEYTANIYNGSELITRRPIKWSGRR